MAGIGVKKLFDRKINVKLIKDQGESKTVNLICPKTGIKPDITIKGSFAANILYNAELKLKNFYSPVDLDSGDGTAGFNWVHIDAGYENSMETALEGQIWTGAQPTPPPDGDTVFSFFTGWFSEWVITPITLNAPAGTSINDIMNFVCGVASQVNPGKLTVELASTLDDSVVSKTKIACTGTISEFCTLFARNNNLTITPEGMRLKVSSRTFSATGSGIIHKLEFMSDVKKTAAGLTITAPWVPSIRPGDLVGVDPKYFSSDISGMFVRLGTNLIVIQEDFEFSTVGSANRMTLMTIGEQL
jgi:hypothetical protein